jgi:ribosomal protein S17E
MKSKILVIYSTNKGNEFIQQFNEEISRTIGCDHEIQAIFNTGSKSLSRAYNVVWEQYEYDATYLFVYIHHDIHFGTDSWGKVLIDLFNENPDTHVVGVAGTDTLHDHGVWWVNEYNLFDTKNLWGNLWHDIYNKQWHTNFTTEKKVCQELQPVVVVDGTFMVIDPDECEQFEEKFTGFHFYDTSFCVRNKLAGKNIYVTEKIKIIHESMGHINEPWHDDRLKFVKLYVDGVESATSAEVLLTVK